MTVRVLGVDDWRQWRDTRLRALVDSPGAFGSTHAREVAFTEADWRDRLEEPTSVCVLAYDGEEHVLGMGGGFTDLPGWLHVVAMWVEPAARGRGVAREVLDALRGWADRRGQRLHLDVETSNALARHVYLGYGFVPTGETRPLRDGSAELVERLVLPVATGSTEGP